MYLFETEIAEACHYFDSYPKHECCTVVEEKYNYSIQFYSSEDLSRRTRESRAELRKYMRKVKIGKKIFYSDRFCTSNGVAKIRSVMYLVIMYRMYCTFPKNFGMALDLVFILT